jgi:flagellar basal-body rod modification protein FlgD
MNPVSSTDAAPPSLFGSASSASGSATPTLSGNDFLQLLVAELQNQNPTSPMSASDFISQMTSLSLMTTMQQLGQEVTTLGQLAEAGAAVSLMGDAVSATSGNGPVSGTVVGVAAASGGGSPTLTLATAGGNVTVPLSAVQQVSPPAGTP